MTLKKKSTPGRDEIKPKKINNMKPKNTDQIGRDEVGQFAKGNPGKPKGATHRTTKELRESIVHFLLDKADEVHEIWDTLEPKDRATFFLHLSKLVMPTTPPQVEQLTPFPVPRIIMPEIHRPFRPQPEDLNHDSDSDERQP